MKEVMEVSAEFFELPTEEKSKFCGGDEVDVSRMSCKLSTTRVCSHMRSIDVVLFDREVVGEYARKVRELSLWVLEMLSEGLGLELGYFGEGLAQVQMMSVNNYPPCPNPRLTLGVPKHSDASLLTVLLQGKVNGLQVLLKDGKWVGVQPLPNALVVNIGNVLQVTISIFEVVGILRFSTWYQNLLTRDFDTECC
ncbi:Flavanone 3-dioxygenase 2 [Linum perenne]